MQQSLLYLPIAVPLLFWAAYHYHKDRALPEPPQNLLLCFVLGVIATLLSKLLYAGLEPIGLRYDAFALGAEYPLGLLAYCLLAIGPIEELAKMIPFAAIVLRFRALDEPVDGIIYASFIGLGFAAAENVQYLNHLAPLEAAGRGFAGPVIHILFASIWAHWTTRAWLRRRSVAKASIIGFGIAALLHGGYDFLVLLEPYSALPLAAVLIVVIWIWRLRLLRHMHAAAMAGGTAGHDPPRSNNADPRR